MKRTILLVMSVGAALAACGSEDAVSVADQWARASAPTQTVGAVYFDLTVADDDTLVGASVSPTVAADAQIHEVVMADEMSGDDMSGGEMSGDEMSGDEMTEPEGSEDMGDSEDRGDSGDMGDMEGPMTMREMDGGLALVGGETVSFEPGSYHVMLLDLVDPLEVGERFDVTLDFATADDMTIEVEVAETAP